jgi:hypothetical protein
MLARNPRVVREHRTRKNPVRANPQQMHGGKLPANGQSHGNGNIGTNGRAAIGVAPVAAAIFAGTSMCVSNARAVSVTCDYNGGWNNTSVMGQPPFFFPSSPFSLIRLFSSLVYLSVRLRFCPFPLALA